MHTICVTNEQQLLSQKYGPKTSQKTKSDFHLEIDPRGDEMSIYEKEGGKPCVHVHKHIYTRGIWRHAPQEMLVLDSLKLLLVYSQGLFLWFTLKGSGKSSFLLMMLRQGLRG